MGILEAFAAVTLWLAITAALCTAIDWFLERWRDGQ
jgi:hypothetical protein